MKLLPQDLGNRAYAIGWSLEELQLWLEKNVQPGEPVALYTGRGDWNRYDSVSPRMVHTLDFLEDMGCITRRPTDQEIGVFAWARSMRKRTDAVRKHGAIPIMVTCSCPCYRNEKERVAQLLGVELLTKQEWADRGGPRVE